MKKILLLILAIVVSGCAVHLNTEEIDNISTMCAKNGGLKIAYLYSLGDSDIVCSDGARFTYIVKHHKV